MLRITKEVWLQALHCPTAAWRELRADPEPTSEFQQFQLEQGRELHAFARTLYPEGVTVTSATLKNAAKQTDLFIADGKKILFEATAVSEPFVAKADILIRKRKGWHLIEVKSRTARVNFIDSDLLYDLAYTTMVFRRAGIPIVKASILLPSPEYRYGEPTTALFNHDDLTFDALNIADRYVLDSGEILGLLSAELPLPGSLLRTCRDCRFFKSDCLAAGMANTILDIPFLGQAKLEQLSSQNIVNMLDLPPGFPLSPRQNTIVTSTLTNQVSIKAGRLRKSLDSLSWPCYYLDLEGMQLFQPAFPDHGCHQQVTTQFSLHVRDSIGAELRHFEYLADPARDCRRELAERLINAIGDAGSVVVYGNHEKQSIRRLQGLFPDLSESLKQILSRLFDFLPVVSRHVYHPSFGGRFGLKEVLAALVPEVSLARFEIPDGRTAMTFFGRLVRGDIAPAKRAEIRHELSRYCEGDTLALAHLHEFLHSLTWPPVPNPEFDVDTSADVNRVRKRRTEASKSDDLGKRERKFASTKLPVADKPVYPERPSDAATAKQRTRSKSQLTTKQRFEIFRLVSQDGLTVRQAATKFGVHPWTVVRIVKQIGLRRSSPGGLHALNPFEAC